MVYEDSATTFHQWSTTVQAGGAIHAKGYCAIPYPELKNSNYDKYTIDLLFKEVSDFNIEIKGKIVGKSAGLDFDMNSFLDPRCAQTEMEFNKLRAINLGLGFGFQDLIDMLRSQRTGVALHLLEHENWSQGKSSVSFSDIGLQYRMGQFNGRQLALAAAPSGSFSELHIRTANYLEYAEGTDYFRLALDSFNNSNGFYNDRLPTNHKFQSQSIAGGSQIVGCSSLIYESELDRPQDVDMEVCKQRFENSSLKTTRKATVTRKYSAEELEAIKRKNAQAILRQRAESYIRQHYGPLKNYSSRPHVYESGRVAWRAEDRARGYVVFDRRITYKDEGLDILEYRYNTKGETITFSYKVLYTEL